MILIALFSENFPKLSWKLSIRILRIDGAVTMKQSYWELISYPLCLLGLDVYGSPKGFILWA